MRYFQKVPLTNLSRTASSEQVVKMSKIRWCESTQTILGRHFNRLFGDSYYRVESNYETLIWNLLSNSVICRIFIHIYITQKEINSVFQMENNNISNCKLPAVRVARDQSEQSNRLGTRVVCDPTRPSVASATVSASDSSGGSIRPRFSQLANCIASEDSFLGGPRIGVPKSHLYLSKI